jgi:hypothetical protein
VNLSLATTYTKLSPPKISILKNISTAHLSSWLVGEETTASVCCPRFVVQGRRGVDPKSSPRTPKSSFPKEHYFGKSLYLPGTWPIVGILWGTGGEIVG